MERRVNRKHKRDKRSTHDRYFDFYYYYDDVHFIYLCNLTHSLSLRVLSLRFSSFPNQLLNEIFLPLRSLPFNPCFWQSELLSNSSISFTHMHSTVFAYCHSTWLTGIMRGTKPKSVEGVRESFGELLNVGMGLLVNNCATESNPKHFFLATDDIPLFTL